MSRLDGLLRCPRCHGALEREAGAVRCRTRDCPYADQPFPVSGDQPVLIDFERSIFQRDAYAARPSASIPSADPSLRRRIRELLGRTVEGTNTTAPVIAARMLARLKASAPEPLVLVIGGGTIGKGAARLYADRDVLVVGTDVYATPHTQVVADGHALPFADESFDGVWIQAVLEHVLEPQVVVDEIHRVLKPGGLVYADTPFMQQVHGGAYDFTRFTLSGHRWLFRGFDQIVAGTVAGAGVALVWSIRYYVRSIAGAKASTLATLPFFWARHLGRFAKRGPNADAASSVFFFGSKSDQRLAPRDMPDYYAAQAR